MTGVEGILKELRKSGFPLEIQVGSRFSNSGWTVRHQAISRGEGERNPTYIDILATKLIEGNFARFGRLNFTVVCECKKSENMPWVFYSPPAGHIIRELAAMTYVKTLAEPPLEFAEMSLLAKTHYLIRDPVDRFAQTSQLIGWKEESNSKGKNPKGKIPKGRNSGFNQINEAINQVVSATGHRVRTLRDMIKLVPSAMIVVCPLIVLDGAMYEYNLGIDEEPNVKPTSHVKYLAATIGPEMKVELPNKQSLTTSSTEDFLIDIVVKSSLPQYVGWLEEDMRLIMS